MQGDKPAEKEKTLPEDSGLLESQSSPAQEGPAPAQRGQPAFADETMPSLSAAGELSTPMQVSEKSLVGEVIEQYRIEQVLGRGGMSVVYKGVHSILGTTVAIKTMHAHLVTEPQAVMRFKQEAKAATQLDHPNIIKVTGFGITGSDSPQPYIIMDYLEGCSLSDMIKQKGQLSVGTMLKIFIQVCNALAHAHKKGIVHRDLKPSNIMLLEKDGDPYFVKLVDFGIAKVLGQEGEQAHRLTQTGEVFGSPMYMSPEQCMGRQVDMRSDIYSLGCVLYEALSGKPPHQGNSVFETFHKHISEIPACMVIPDVEKSVVDRLDAVVFRALEKDPDKRFQSMSQFEDEIRSVLETAQLPLTGLHQSFGRRRRSVLRFIQAAPRIAIVLFFVGLALCGTGVFAWSKCSWFFESKHAFRSPATHWFSYMPPNHKRLHMGAAERQSRLDSGTKAMAFAALKYAPNSVQMINLWEQRAKACAELDAPTEEIEARMKIIDYFQYSYDRADMTFMDDPNYGVAAEELAECYIRQGDYRAALPLLKDAARVRSRVKTDLLQLKNPRVYLALGHCYCMVFNSNEALDALEKAISTLSGLSPENPGSFGVPSDSRQLAIAYAMQGDVYKGLCKWSKAEDSYARAEKALKSSEFKKAGEMRSELALARAFVSLNAGRYQESSQFYDQSLPYARDAFHDRKEMQFVLDDYAFALWAKGDLYKAIQMREQSVKLGSAAVR
jgi:serine/threonine protein kinase